MYIQEIRLLSIAFMLPLLFLSYVCYELWVDHLPVSGILWTPKRKFIFLYFWLFRGLT